MKTRIRILAVVLVLCTLTAFASQPNSDYLFRTDKENRVITENGEFDKALILEPVLVTSIGQSADVSMLDALLKKVGATYTFNPTASAEEMSNYKTVIIAAGASSKGLGAAGISQEDEIARAEAMMKMVDDNAITVILMHLGGASRRGPLSDRFSDMVLEKAAYIVMVEDGNQDNKFADFALEKEIPITLMSTIADAINVLKDLFTPAEAT